MNPTKTLPGDYTLLHTIDLSQQGRLLLLLNAVGLLLFILFGRLFYLAAAAIHPDFELELTVSGDLAQIGVAILALLLTLAGILILHELAHGLVFWLLTRERPRFGLRAAYAYAAAPDWFLPRNQYLPVALAPLTLLSLAGLMALPFLPPGGLMLWWFFLTANASGAVGDLYVVGWLLRRPASLVVKDYGDRIDVFACSL